MGSGQSLTELIVEREGSRQRVHPDEMDQQISFESPLCTSPVTLVEPHSARAWYRQPTTPLDELAQNKNPAVTRTDPAAREDQQPHTKSEFQESLEHLGFAFPDVTETLLEAPPSCGNLQGA